VENLVIEDGCNLSHDQESHSAL